ncbi:PDT domain-containing protein [Xylariomycetidae sp. FL2044]|nr:PDT domain-containing protein [Xylariomycetidae sp. FL2044]
MPVVTIKDIFDTTQSGRATYGVVPFENSTNGSVVFTLDHFADRHGDYTDISVCGEIYLDVHHCILGRRVESSSSSSSSDPSSTTTTTATATLTTSSPPQSSKTLHPQDPSPPVSGQCTPTPQHPNPSPPRSHPLTSLAHIRRVYSHPQAFGQCARFLGAYLRGVETVDVSSTSRAAELARDDATGTSAAISSAVAAELVGDGGRLEILARNVEDREDNTTRFFVLRKGVSERAYGIPELQGKRVPRRIGGSATSSPSTSSQHPQPPSSSTTKPATTAPDQNSPPSPPQDPPILSLTKSLIAFTVPHHSPGALADVLGCFRASGLNLTSINSRPAAGLDRRPFQYVFLVEFEGHRFEDPEGRVAGVLERIAEVNERNVNGGGWCRWLGSWENMRRL